MLEKTPKLLLKGLNIGSKLIKLGISVQTRPGLAVSCHSCLKVTPFFSNTSVPSSLRNNKKFQDTPKHKLFKAVDPYASGILNYEDKIPIIQIIFSLASKTLRAMTSGLAAYLQLFLFTCGWLQWEHMDDTRTGYVWLGRHLQDRLQEHCDRRPCWLMNPSTANYKHQWENWADFMVMDNSKNNLMMMMMRRRRRMKVSFFPLCICTACGLSGVIAVIVHSFHFHLCLLCGPKLHWAYVHMRQMDAIMGNKLDQNNHEYSKGLTWSQPLTPIPTVWHQNSSCELQAWQECSYLISALVLFKKLTKITEGCLPCLSSKSCHKAAKPQADPCP